LKDIAVAELNQLRELLARSCRILGKLNMTKEPSGHVSARIPGSDRILIKARGPGESGLKFVTERDLITVDLNGKKLDGPEELAAPQEVFIHTWMYRARPEIQSVVHVHPLTVVLFTICNKPLLPLFGAYDPSGLRLVVEGIPTYPRSILIANDDLGKELAEVMGDRSACMMRGHGITSAGVSIQEATLNAIKLNDVAEVNYRANLLGDPQPIPAEEIARLPGGSGEQKRPGHNEAVWRYYCNLLDE
jgi:L-fuculose-phosphate aldolase